MKNSMNTYKYLDDYVAIDKDNDIYILEKNNSFYKLDKDSFDSIVDLDKLVEQKKIKDNQIYVIAILFIIVATLLIYFCKYQYIIIDKNIAYSMILLLINIIIHELGHIVLLKYFYPDSKIKIGFKLIYIYPAFYVDTSYSYMIPKYKRMAVYLAGNLMNCIFLLSVMIFFPDKIIYCYLIVTNILVNFIPIIKSDGYYALIAFFNKYTNDKGKVKTFIDDFIRGIMMFIFLNFIYFINNNLIL